MTYEQALERARTLPMMRPHWRDWDQVMYVGRDGKPFLELSRSERCGYRPSEQDQIATDWKVAP